MLAVPALLEDLLAAGCWPRTADEACNQNLRPLVDADRIRRLAPEESRLYLYVPPLAGVSRDDPFFTSEVADPTGIDPELVLQLGDFGLGADAPILLDYRFDRNNPRVIRLRWANDGTPNRWVVMADDFQTFVTELGLWQPHK